MYPLSYAFVHMDKPPTWLSRESSYLSDSSLLVFLVSWPPITRTSLPRLIIFRTIWSKWSQSRWSPLVLRNVFWVHYRIRLLILATLSLYFARKTVQLAVYVPFVLYCLSYTVLIKSCYLFNWSIMSDYCCIAHSSDTGNIFVVFFIPYPTAS
jgi:hypothetical protein